MSKLSFNQEVNFEYGVAKNVAPAVRRIVANNSGPFTFKGTNTYIIGRGEVAIIDPGPELSTHREALLTALGNERITHIFLTHTHLDHSSGIATLQDLTGAITLGFDPQKTHKRTNNRGRIDIDSKPNRQEFIDRNFKPDKTLQDGEKVEGLNWQLEAIHTPGHAPDHLCFAFPQDNALFSGDQIMAWNTSVIAPPEGHMGDYVCSLEKLLDRKEEVFFPGHGGRITSPRRVVRAYIMHRLWREAAIFNGIKQGLHTIPELTNLVYADVDDKLLNACRLSVQAHLEYLLERSKIKTVSSNNEINLQTEFYTS